jgi:hypothetical protein
MTPLKNFFRVREESGNIVAIKRSCPGEYAVFWISNVMLGFRFMNP